MISTEAELLRELITEIRLLRIDLAEQRPAIDVRLSLLMHATYATLGDERFSAAQLVALSRSPLRPALQHAVAGRTPHSIGKLLCDHIGRTIDGLKLDRIGRSRPAVYRLLAADSPDSRMSNPWRI